MRRWQTAQFLWRLMWFRPWLFWTNCLSIILLFVTGLIPGFAAQSFRISNAITSGAFDWAYSKSLRTSTRSLGRSAPRSSKKAIRRRPTSARR